MTIMRLARLLPVLALLLLLMPQIATPAAAELNCTASVTNLAFGNITVRDGAADQTTATATYTCSGGTPNAQVSACLGLGAGSGGAGSGSSPRYMLRGDGSQLAYEIKSGGQSGASWDTVTTTDTLNSSGARTFTETLFGEVTSTGSTVKGGSYSSSFAGFTVFTYGEGGCSSPPDTSVAFAASATVSPSCTLSVSPLDFGSIEAPQTNVDAVTSISATCTLNVPYAITLGSGLNPSNGLRRMKNGTGDFLPYGLYLDPSHLQPWNEQATNDYDGSGSGTAQDIPVYGRIPDATAPAGTYTDTVVVTITY